MAKQESPNKEISVKFEIQYSSKEKKAVQQRIKQLKFQLNPLLRNTGRAKRSRQAMRFCEVVKRLEEFTSLASNSTGAIS